MNYVMAQGLNMTSKLRMNKPSLTALYLSKSFQKRFYIDSGLCI